MRRGYVRNWRTHRDRDLGECEICGTPLVDNGQWLEFWGSRVWKEEIECPNEEYHPEPWDPPNEYNLADQPIVYVAGPYTSAPEENTLKAIAVAETLVGLGFVPYIPHLCHYWHQDVQTRRGHSRKRGWWCEYANVFLQKCDCLLRLSGESRGADNEVKLAEMLEIPVFYDFGALLVAKMQGEI